MGLKTTNYEVKDKGIILPEAYALIRDIEINGDLGIATIVVQQSRELAVNKAPFEEHTIQFKVNRNENPYETAYAKAKAKIVRNELIDKEVDGENKKVFVVKEYPNKFTDWEDDFV